MRKVFALLVVFSVSHGAGFAAPLAKEDVMKGTELIEHRFDLKGCSFTLKDKASLVFLRIDVGSRKSGVYRVIDDPKTDWGISISFICNDKPAQTFCPDTTKVVDADEADQRYLKDLGITHYAQINDTYYGMANAYNVTAAPPPRPRDLVWCIGDDHRALWGESNVGNERQEYTDRILKILRTIRFVDPLDPEHSDSQGSPGPNDNIH